MLRMRKLWLGWGILIQFSWIKIGVNRRVIDTRCLLSKLLPYYLAPTTTYVDGPPRGNSFSEAHGPLIFLLAPGGVGARISKTSGFRAGKCDLYTNFLIDMRDIYHILYQVFGQVETCWYDPIAKRTGYIIVLGGLKARPPSCL